MKNTMFSIKAVVTLAIALAFMMPVSAYFTQSTPMITKNKIMPYQPLLLPSGWIEQASGFWEASRGINYIHAIDENIAWAVGYDGSGGSLPVQEYTRTVNGGDLWQADYIDTAPTDGKSAMIFALDENTAWVPLHSGTPQGIWKTEDAGATWVRQDTASFSGTGSFPNCVHFFDENNGWCQGDPIDGYFEMYTTTDGGDTWVRVPSQNIPAPLPNEWGTVGYYDALGDTLWFGTQCVTSPGRVFKSTDKGLTWTVANTPFTSNGWVDVRMRDELNGLAMDKRAAGSFLAETSDGGATWTAITPTGPFYGYDIAYVPGTANTWISTGAASSASGASYSVDGGHSWTDYPEVLGIQLLDCDFIEGGIGWAGSFSVDEFTGGIYKYIPGAAEPVLNIESVTGGKGLTAIVKNSGTGDATDVEYTISITGGLFVNPRNDSGTIGTLLPGQSANISFAPKGFGLGIIFPKPEITISVTCSEGKSDEVIKEARIIFSNIKF